MPPPTPHGVRRDVARNRERLLESARVIFAVRGLTATLDEIAEHAGMGAGTAYRHFGSRAGIVAALFGDVARSFIADAERALKMADPWEGLVSLVLDVTEQQARDRALHQVFVGHHGASLDADDWDRLTRAIAEVVERAKQIGALRKDVESADLVTLFATLGPAYDLSATTGIAVWRRQVDFFLRGVRADAPEAAIDTPPAATADVMAALLHDAD